MGICETTCETTDIEPKGEWSTVQVAGHPCRWLEPSVPHPSGFSLLYLHDSGQVDLATQPAITELFIRHGLRVVAPQTRASWWSDRLCEEFDSQVTAEQYVTQSVMPYLAERSESKPGKPGKVGLLGIEMGGQGALRLAYKYPDRFPVVAGIASAIDYHRWLDVPRHQTDLPQPELTAPLHQLYRDREDARQQTATLHIHPLNWPRHQFFCCDPSDHWCEGNDRLRGKLASLGVPHVCDLETEAGGHGWGYFNAMASQAVEFLVERLEQEQRRIE